MSSDGLPLVSIITPCFNGESHILPYIDSMLAQTYKNVEYIFVNDGSTDGTEGIILSYKEQFEAKGWSFIYIKQENGGQASAINQGLAIFSGDYLSCLDSDDIFEPTFLEECSIFLNEHQEYGFCYPWVRVVSEDKEELRICARNISKDLEDSLFRDWIRNRNVPIPPFYMARRAAVLRVLPERKIAPYAAGQNYQVLLPLSYHYKCGYIKKVLANYVVRESSHSKNITDWVARFHDVEEIIIDTIKSMDMPEVEKNYYTAFTMNIFSRKIASCPKVSKPNTTVINIHIYYFLGLPLIKVTKEQDKTKYSILGLRLATKVNSYPKDTYRLLCFPVIKIRRIDEYKDS